MTCVSGVDLVRRGNEDRRRRVPQIADEPDRVARRGRAVEVAEDGEHLVEEGAERRGLLGLPARGLRARGIEPRGSDLVGDLVPGLTEDPRRGREVAEGRRGGRRRIDRPLRDPDLAGPRLAQEGRGLGRLRPRRLERPGGEQEGREGEGEEALRAHVPAPSFASAGPRPERDDTPSSH